MSKGLKINANWARSKSLGRDTDAEILTAIEKIIRFTVEHKPGDMECSYIANNQMSYSGERKLREAGFYFRGESWTYGKYKYTIYWADKED